MAAAVETTTDNTAVELFAKQQDVYQRTLDGDYLEHSKLFACVAAYLAERVKGPFHMLDLGCGDAQHAARLLGAGAGAIDGHAALSYTGVDLSPPSLALARANLAAAAPRVDVELVEADMAAFAR